MRALKMIIVLVYIYVVGFIQVIRGEEYTLNTPIGDITGTIQDVADDSTVTKFLGIPFAEPPVGNLRFKKPVAKPTPLTSPFDATRFGPACAQFSQDNVTEKSEDCLFLNVYVPFNMSSNGIQGNKKAVMVWIYGGAFVYGASNSYDSSLLSTFGDVIVVTLNYRLAILGFLTTGDALVPGNFGLWDQHLAIQWVHDNIEAYGGDVGKVTIFGESAGSASVVYQCFYPGNIGLFQNAIAQSGSLTSTWAYTDTMSASRNVNFLAEKFGCTQSNTADIIACMKQIPMERFDGPAVTTTPAYFTPVGDGDFVLDTPANIMYGQSTATEAYTMFNSVNLMIGFTSADGLGDTYSIMQLLGITDPNEFRLTKDQFEFLVPQYLQYYTSQPEVSKALSLATINEYTDWSDPYSDDKRNKQLTKFLTDPFFAAPTVLTANLHSNSNTTSTYVYEFAVRPMNRFVPVPPPLDGSDVMNHADDLFFVFGDDIEKVMADEQYSHLLQTYWTTMTLWTNFAKSGNPNLPRDVSSMINSTWPEYSSDQGYIRLTTDMSPESVKNHPRQRTANFWNNIVPTLIESSSQNNVPREDKTVTVTTPVGDIIGVESYVPFSEDCGFRVAAYRGIPYAKAPVGNLRFQKPVAKEPFGEPFDATQYGPACYQLDFFGTPTQTPKSEDCLLLNVFVPSIMDTQAPRRKAVMIWIHGGGYTVGESNIYDPSVLVGYGDVIVVTINYRLGVYGFMTTGDNVIPSNLALWDQHTAIQWVHDNIEAFGGDADRVTIFGESAGAGCVGHQVFYPGNSGLFQRAIGQSGTMGSPGSYIDLQTSLQYTRKFAEQTGCSLASTTNFLECLQSKPIEDLQMALSRMTFTRRLVPTRDNVFVLDVPENLISGTSSAQEAINMFHSIDYLTGFASADGLLLSRQWPMLLGQADLLTFTLTRSGFENILVPFMVNRTVTADSSGQIKRSVLHEYTDWTDPDSEPKRAQKLVDMFTDESFAVPAIRATELHTLSPTNRNTYLYEFSVRPLTRPVPIPALFEGPDVMNHAEDIQYVLGTDITAVSDSEEHHQQLRVYKVTMTMWSNFAKSGNPNTPNDVTKYLYTSWPKYESSRQYLEITPEVTQNAAKQRPRLQAVNFWSNLLPESSGLSQRFDSCITDTGSQIRPGIAILFPILYMCLKMLYWM